MSILGSGTGAAADVVEATVWWQHIAVSYISHIAALCYISHIAVSYISHIAALCYISMLSGWAESMVDSEVDCW